MNFAQRIGTIGRILALVLQFAVLASCRGFEPKMPGPCERYAGMPGPEDIDLDAKRGRLLVSSQERRRLNADGSWPAGAIFAQPLKGAPFVLELKGRDQEPFHPHGISLVEDTETLLYVINHLDHERNAVEVFRVEQNALVFLKRLASPVLHHPNDLVALPGDEFYASNDHGWSGLAAKLEDLFAAGLGEVVHYRKGSWSVAATGIAYANGVQVNRSQDRLFAAGTRDRGVHVFNRDAEGRLSRISFIDVGTGADNLMWTDSENLVVAGHASIFSFLRHASDAKNPSPSEIMNIHIPTGKVTRILATDSEIHASSTGIVSEGRVYIAQVFEPYVSACKID